MNEPHTQNDTSAIGLMYTQRTPLQQEARTMTGITQEGSKAQSGAHRAANIHTTHSQEDPSPLPLPSSVTGKASSSRRSRLRSGIMSVSGHCRPSSQKEPGRGGESVSRRLPYK